MTHVDFELARLGEALERAASADLHKRNAAVRRRRRRWFLAAGLAIVALPSLALAASELIRTEDVERSLPAGTLALLGTEPTCTVVEPNVEYHCTLRKAPAPEVPDWTGTVEHTVDETKHVNGGCRSVRADGREWRCYIGQAAVEQKIISSDFLGEYAPTPGVG